MVANLIAPANANVFERDKRVFEAATSHPMAAVGLLANGRRQVGSAFLIGECHIMTAYHSAFFVDRESGDTAGHPKALDFYIGPDEREAGVFRAASVARVVERGSYYPGAPRGMIGDWAILKLDDCLGRRFGHLKIVPPGDAMLGRPIPLLTLGFPDSSDRRAGISVEAGCHARESGPVAGLVGVDCAFERGMSGGPVLMRLPGGEWGVVGIMQLRFRPMPGVLPVYSSRHRNQMVHASAFHRAAERVLARASALESGRPGEDQSSPAFEANALDQLLRGSMGLGSATEALTVAKWRGDLNDDRVDELLFRVCGQTESGAETCSVHLIERDERGGPRRAAMVSAASGIVRLGFARLNGWRPLFVGVPAQTRRLVFVKGRHVVEPVGARGMGRKSNAAAGEEILHIRLSLPAPSLAPASAPAQD